MSESGNSSNTVIVFGAHPDDIEIGMAGTISRLAACGNRVLACIASIPDERTTRIKEALDSARILGIEDVIVLPIKSAQLGYNRHSIGAIDSVIKQFRPHSVFTHWIEDSHQDHVNVTRCIIAATRKNNFNVYMYEQTIPGGITPAGFRPQYLIDISQHIDRKLESIHAHASQLKRNGAWWLEGVRGRAMYRGYQIHTQFAEAFEIIKINGDTNLFGGERAHAQGHAAKTVLPHEEPALVSA
jgi:LmbE family N-acetylglucosaminyl deacetylase